jgi:hypothetical protein
MTLMSFFCSLLPSRCGCEAPERDKRSAEKVSSAEVESNGPKQAKPAHEPPTRTEGRH